MLDSLLPNYACSTLFYACSTPVLRLFYACVRLSLIFAPLISLRWSNSREILSALSPFIYLIIYLFIIILITSQFFFINNMHPLIAIYLAVTDTKKYMSIHDIHCIIHCSTPLDICITSALQSLN